MTYPVLIIVLMLLGVLFFGKELPSVAKQVGQGMLEFRKGISELSDIKNFDTGSSRARPGASGGTLGGEMEEDEHQEVIGTKFSPQSSSDGLLRDVAKSE